MKGIPFSYQSLSYDSSELEDNSKLSDNKIGDKAVISLQIKNIRLGITVKNGTDLNVEVMMPCNKYAI